MIRRARVAWLLETPEPTGAAMMAARRIAVLRDRCASTLLALSGTPGKAPRGTPLHGILSAKGMSGEVRVARADLVVTTSELTLASAAPRLGPGARLVHFLHTRPEIALANERFMRTMSRVSHVVVPIGVDTVHFAAQAGLDPAQVSAADDFTLDTESLLGTGRPRVMLAAGRLGESSGVLELAEAFRLALPDLPGWQLRIAGAGPLRRRVHAFAETHGIGHRLLVLGPRHDLAEQYLDAGFAVRIETDDANGLSVHEALAAGVPVLGASAVPAVSRMVRHGKNGWILGRVDPEAIADGILALADDARRGSCAAAARAERAGLLTPDSAAELHLLFGRILDADRAA